MQRLAELETTFTSTLAGSFTEATKTLQLLGRLALGLPDEFWWFPVLLLLLLGLTATIDAFEGRVPDVPIVIGLFIVVGVLGYFGGWPEARDRLALGFCAALFLYAANHFYYNWQKTDAIGMGDAKWTALAVASFHLKPALVAWVVGAWLGLIWLALAFICDKIRRVSSDEKTVEAPKRVHFAPFLFIGLLAGIYWQYLH